MIDLVQPWISSLVGVALVGYAVAALGKKAAGVRLPWVKASPRAPVDDLRLVIDLAARLRDAGKTEAVKVCQSLLDELLKPGATP